MRGVISVNCSRAIAFFTILTALIFLAISCALGSESPETNALALHTRTFKLDANNLYNALQNIVRTQSETSTNFGTLEGGEKRGRQFIVSIDTEYELRLAVGNFFKDVGVNLAPPKGFSYDDRESLLTVRGTDEDLEFIEQVVDSLSNAPPEVQIKVRYFEMDQEATFTPGLMSFSQPNTDIRKSAIWGSGVFTESEFETLLKHLKEKAPTASENKGEVTTLSGRQGNFSLTGFQGEPTTNIQPSFDFYRDSDAPSLTLDVIPNVASDGYTIQLTLIPTCTDIVTNGAATIIAPDGSEIPIIGQLPIPRSRVRQAVTSLTVWDGQTAVLLLNPDYSLNRKELVIFVTATILDPSGNRKNSPESLPFVEKAVPQQTLR